MVYRVVYTDEFLGDIDRHVDYLLTEGAGVDTVAAWYRKLFERLDDLGEMPRDYPVDELQGEENGRETRKLVYRNYQAFYSIDDKQRCVFLMKFQHGARRQ